MLPFALGVPVLVLPVLAATVQTSARTLGLVAASFFFLTLCLTSVLWGNTVSDAATLEDTVNGWFFGAAFLMVWAPLFSGVAVARYCRRSR
mgnify:CR=1 FL=1